MFALITQGRRVPILAQALVGFDSGRLNDATPFFNFASEMHGELCRRTRRDFGALLQQDILHVLAR